MVASLREARRLPANGAFSAADRVRTLRRFVFFGGFFMHLVASGFPILPALITAITIALWAFRGCLST
ncbi:hypothetical protein WJ977_03655 [Achromobacter xylosoxidans]